MRRCRQQPPEKGTIDVQLALRDFVCACDFVSDRISAEVREQRRNELRLHGIRFVNALWLHLDGQLFETAHADSRLREKL